jgi:hypothetical protein
MESFLEHIDRTVAARNPAISEPMWTLGDVARCVVEQTPQAVNGLSIDEEKPPDALIEIHDALVRHQIEAWSATTLEPMPRRLPAATSSIYEFAFEEINGLLHTLTIHPSTHERPFKDLRFKSIEVRRHWRGAEPIPRPLPANPSPAIRCCPARRAGRQTSVTARWATRRRTTVTDVVRTHVMDG